MKGGVAPRAGAWVETSLIALKPKSVQSHPVRVRGLKLCHNITPLRAFGVAPRAGAWVETHMSCAFFVQVQSHPVRVRGLKPGRDQSYVVGG